MSNANTKQSIKIKIECALTNQVLNDRTIELPNQKATHEYIKNLHSSLQNKFPDCYVNFRWTNIGSDKPSFIFGTPLNMKLDEIKIENGEMSFEAYCDKWYSSSDENEIVLTPQ